jgi:hypothetical protein
MGHSLRGRGVGSAGFDTPGSPRQLNHRKHHPPRNRLGGKPSSFVYDAVRTPFGRLGKALSGIRPDDLAATVLAALAARNPSLDPGEIDDIILGDANGAG